MTTNIVPMLWIAWAAFALVTALLYAYRSSLTRDEDTQIFLDDAFAHEEALQTQIVSRVKRLEPAIRVSIGLTVLMTVAVVVYYSWGVYKALFT
jgi:cytochrome c-type biogenesis protein CcmH/NrfG